jgi:hypothetical protein
MVRILKCSRKPKKNLSGAKWRALRPLKANDLLTILQADKGNGAVVLGTSDYNQNIANLPQDKAYAKLKMDPMESLERKTVLRKKSSFAEGRCANNYDHKVPGHLSFMGCQRFTNLLGH